MSEHIKTELDQRVLTLRLNRPDKKNALTLAMYSASAAAIEDAANNADVRVLLIAGAPTAFSAGNDIEGFLNMPPLGDDNPVLRFMRALALFPKPAIAAVNGVAIGIGSTMLLHTDLAYAGVSTRFQFPFVNLGICPEYASTYLLPRIMGHARAAELTYFGEPFTAKTAQEYGLINAVLPDADVEAHAVERARKLATQPPNALRVTKKLLKRWGHATVLEAIELEAEHFVPMLKEAESAEALGAFMQKRKPDFSKFK
ncbi:MAG: enoyl-CoA hydratase [Nevskia sp.]|nr:enoyl-CoA hydratase [Nevskia sp.]